jgi:hypothetical protein
MNLVARNQRNNWIRFCDPRARDWRRICMGGHEIDAEYAWEGTRLTQNMIHFYRMQRMIAPTLQFHLTNTADQFLRVLRFPPWWPSWVSRKNRKLLSYIPEYKLLVVNKLPSISKQAYWCYQSVQIIVQYCYQF